ncbi:MAG: hypothetical protein HQL32_11995 [Planctomycetes bacterium]|nr:hypothetical protein [Planctomycetota bacterium]
MTIKHSTIYLGPEKNESGHDFKLLIPTHFSLIELLVSVALLAVLVSLLQPALNNALQASKRLACSHKQMGIGVAGTMHMNDYNDHMPLVNIEKGFSHLVNVSNHKIIDDKLLGYVAALSDYMSIDLSNIASNNLDKYMKNPKNMELFRAFQCPSEDRDMFVKVIEASEFNNGHLASQSYTHYGMNTSILGIGDPNNSVDNRLGADMNLIISPTSTLLFTGTQGNGSGGLNGFNFFGHKNNSPTLGDLVMKKLNTHNRLVYERHNDLSLNIMFSDFHTENVHLTDFYSVKLSN